MLASNTRVGNNKTTKVSRFCSTHITSLRVYYIDLLAGGGVANKSVF